MGGWDCYCALCSGPLSTDSVEYGCNDKETLKERRRRIAWKQEKLAEKRRRLDDDSIWQVSECDDDSDSQIFDYDERTKYDPDKLDSRDVDWIGHCRVLGFNPDASGVTKAFVSGRGREQDAGCFVFTGPGDDPNDPGEEDVIMYHDYNEECIPGYPFHETCYDILVKRLGYTDKQQVDKDVLFSAMGQKFRGVGCSLCIDYGSMDGPDQYWLCVSGFEVCASLGLVYNRVLTRKSMS
jgi:hypothetical protein